MNDVFLYCLISLLFPVILMWPKPKGICVHWWYCTILVVLVCLSSSAADTFASVVWHDSESWNLGSHATLHST